MIHSYFDNCTDDEITTSPPLHLFIQYSATHAGSSDEGQELSSAPLSVETILRPTSSLVFAWVLKQPSMVEVTVVAPGF